MDLGLVGISLGKPNLKWRNCAAWLLFQTGATLRACRAEIEDTRYPGMNVTLYFEDCNRESHSKHRREWLWRTSAPPAASSTVLTLARTASRPTVELTRVCPLVRD